MSQICNPCAESPVCLEASDRYSLQDDVYYFVLNCLPGFFCGGNNTMFLVCCDGVIMQQTLPQGLTAAQRQAYISELIASCARKIAFCEGNGDGTTTDDPNGNNDGTDPDNPIQLYGNRPQSARVNCPDGSPFTYTVPAGLFIARSQALADSAALNYARTLAIQLKICLTGPLRTCCNGVAYSSTMVASGGVSGNFRWNVIGSLPTGLVAIPVGHNGLRIQGIPTTNGNYTFTVRATDSAGNFMAKVITIRVWGITDTTLPDGVFAANYDHQLTTTNGTAPYTYALVSGGFPLGVDITSTGLITGVVGEEGAFTVGIRVRDSAGRTCSKEFTLTVPVSDPNPCAYWTCDEVAGNRIDSVAALPWVYADAPGTGVAWIGSTPGLYSNAVRCYEAVAGSAVASLAAGYSAQIATAGNGFSMAGWFKIISTPASSEVTLTWTVDDGVDDWKLQIRLSANPVAKIFDEFSADQNIFFTPTVGDWHFFHIFHNPTDQYMYFQLDDGAATNVALPVTIPATTTGFLTLFASTSLGNAAEVLIDELALKCDRPFTESEVTYLYNAGAGRTWPLV